MTLTEKHRLVVGLAFTKLADLLVSAKTTLPALMISLGCPVWMIGWLVPIRESGALLPQAALGVLLRRFKARHVVWRLGMIVQLSSVLALVIVAFFFENFTAGIGILVALSVLSLGRSACSLTFKDIEADKVNKGDRGRLIGLTSVVSGGTSVVAAIPLVIYQNSLSDTVVVAILVAASFAYVLAFTSITPLKTYVESATSSQDSQFDFDRKHVYRFIIVRSLFVHSALVAPYFMLDGSQDPQTLLPYFLAAQALASMLSSMIWGWISDTSARLAFQLAGGVAILACVSLLVVPVESPIVMGALFFVLSVAHSGVRTARKTYSLDIVEGQARTEFVAFSNTVIGIVLLVLGGIYSILSAILPFSVVYIMAALLTVGVVMSIFLPNEKAHSDNEKG